VGMNALEKPYRPYLMEPAVAVLEQVLEITQPRRVFEFGSGRSTPWLAERAVLVSVEHEPAWYRMVQQALDEEGLQAELLLVGREELGASIDAYEDESFGLVFVDCYQHQRSIAIEHAKSKVAWGGWLVVDDYHFEKVQETLQTGMGMWDMVLIQGNKTGPEGAYRYASTAFLRRGVACCS